MEYRFPISINAAFTGFTAEYEGKIIKSEVKEKEEAK